MSRRKRFFMPETCENGEGSTNTHTFLGTRCGGFARSPAEEDSGAEERDDASSSDENVLADSRASPPAASEVPRRDRRPDARVWIKADPSRARTAPGTTTRAFAAPARSRAGRAPTRRGGRAVIAGAR